MPSAFAASTLSAAEPDWVAELRLQQTAVAVIVGLTAFRAILALLDRTELSTDEAQYWFWSQTFEFGAYSKPPLIGWIIGVSTELFGQSVSAVRLPAALFHGATALVLFHAAFRIATPQVALIAAVSYCTTPAVALGSALMTTDTPMLLAAAVAMNAQIGLAEARLASKRAIGLAVLLGVAMGLGFLAKHAMLFWLVGALIAAWVSHRFRPRTSDAVLAALAMVAVTLPHLLWLVGNDFITLRHIQDITHGETISAIGPLVFLAQQCLVMGPILFPALLICVAGATRSSWSFGLATLVLTPLVIVLGQAIKGPVLANWAVLYLIPGSVLVAFWLVGKPRLTRVSIGLGLALAVATPVVKIAGTGLPGPNGKPLLSRYLGHSETALRTLQAATKAGAATLIADGRGLMADLSWFGADVGFVIRALPPDGKPTHHWEETASFDPGVDPGPVVLLWLEGRPLPCGNGVHIGRFDAPPGAYGGNAFALWYLTDPDCLILGGSHQ